MSVKKLTYMDDVNNYAAYATDVIEETLVKILGNEFILTVDQENRLFDVLQEILSEHCESDEYICYN